MGTLRPCAPRDTSHINTTTNNNNNKMQNIVYVLFFVAAATASPSEVVDSDTKAEVQGNCLTVDSTGAQWCYVDSEYSSCQDLVPSLRFPNNPWSYEACATPAPGSLLCPALANPILPAVVPSAPIPPIAPIAPSDLLPHPEVVVGPAHGHHDHHV